MSDCVWWWPLWAELLTDYPPGDSSLRARTWSGQQCQCGPGVSVVSGVLPCQCQPPASHNYPANQKIFFISTQKINLQHLILAWPSWGQFERILICSLPNKHLINFIKSYRNWWLMISIILTTDISDRLQMFEVSHSKMICWSEWSVSTSFISGCNSDLATSAQPVSIWLEKVARETLRNLIKCNMKQQAAQSGQAANNMPGMQTQGSQSDSCPLWPCHVANTCTKITWHYCNTVWSCVLFRIFNSCHAHWRNDFLKTFKPSLRRIIFFYWTIN